MYHLKEINQFRMSKFKMAIEGNKVGMQRQNIVI